MTFKQYIKDRLRDDPEWEPTYAKKVPMGWKKLKKQFNLGTLKLRGRGYTRPFKDTTKKARKQSRASRRINRK